MLKAVSLLTQPFLNHVDIDESIEIFQDLNNKVQLASLYLLKANVLIDRKKFNRVEKCIDKAKKYMKRLNDAGLESNLQITKEKYNDLT